MAKAPVFGARTTADQVLAGIDLSGKRILVTGCGSGIGLEVMQSLAANGAQVFGLSRTLDSAQRACDQVAYETEPMACDLGDLDSINGVVQDIRSRGIQLDGIVASAAVAYLPALNTRYGVEMQFLVNHIGHFSLITQLQDLLKDGSSRVVVVSDRAALAGRNGIMFDNLAGQRFYSADAFYGQSKLANLLFVKELARRLRPRAIAVNAADPGVSRATRLHQHRSPARRAWQQLGALFAKSPAQGAATVALLAGSTTVSGVSGEFWQDCRAAHAGEAFDHATLAAELWRLSEEIIASRRAPRIAPSEAAGALAAA